MSFTTLYIRNVMDIAATLEEFIRHSLQKEREYISRNFFRSRKESSFDRACVAVGYDTFLHK